MSQEMGYEEYEDQEYKGKGREKKLDKKRNMMRVNGRHLKSVILPLLEKKSKQAKSDLSKDRVTKRQNKTFSYDYTY